VTTAALYLSLTGTTLPLASLLFGVFVGANGALLLFLPDQFLRFYDFFGIPVSDRTRGEWRTHLHEPGYKILGLVFLLVGLIIAVTMMAELWRP
jgi:hypothetical protein